MRRMPTAAEEGVSVRFTCATAQARAPRTGYWLKEYSFSQSSPEMKPLDMAPNTKHTGPFGNDAASSRGSTSSPFMCVP